MSDLISRKAVLEEIQKIECEPDYQHVGEDWAVGLIIAENIVESAESIESTPSAEPERRWIPVTERLPKKENKSYWVCTDTKYQCECRWTNNIYGIGESNDWGWKIFDIPQYTKVIAWMPLPEPWRGE